MISSTTFSSLRNDILFKIFIHLPLTSIYLLKSVSKVWLSILSNHNFITEWFQFNSKSLPWIQYHTITPYYPDRYFYPLKFRNAYPDSHSQFISRNDYRFSFEFLVNEKPMQRLGLLLLGSSNGLVLCLPRQLSGPDRYHVCNPLTGKWVSLPAPPYYHTSQYEYTGISCENSLSASCRYKVVCIPGLSATKKFNVDMFDSDLGEWRSFDVSCHQNVFRGSDKNFITLSGILFSLEGRDRMLVYDLNQNNESNEHQCSLIDFPGSKFTWHEFDGEFDIFNGRTLGESAGRICYARTRVTQRQITVSVWMLDEDNWQMLHKNILVRDSLPEICFQPCDVIRIRVLGFSPVDRNVILLGCGHWVWWYNIQTRNFEELSHSSLLANRDTGVMYESFVLKTMPTILPSPSWIHEGDDLPPKYSTSVEDVVSFSQLSLFE